MKQLNESDSLYLSGFLENTGIYLNFTETDKTVRGYSVVCAISFSCREEFLKLINDMLGIHKKMIRREKQHIKIVHCDTKKSSVLKNKSRAIYFSHNELRELLPMLSFKLPHKERLRVLMIEVLEILDSLNHLYLIKYPRKRSKRTELEKRLNELMEENDAINNIRLEYIRHKAET